jgi:hypothetical protein
LKQDYAGVQKGVLKMKQGFAGCESAFRIENMVLQDYNGAFWNGNRVSQCATGVFKIKTWFRSVRRRF